MSTLDLLRKTMAKVTHCNEGDITLETLLKDVKADSLDWVQIIVGVENTLDIEIDTEKMQEMATIGDFVNYIDSYTK